MGKGMKVALAIAGLAFASVACAEVQTKVVDYQQGDTPLQGFLAWDDAAHGKRPGIVVVHEWWGHNEYVRERARQLAKAGYVAFALDMYGKGKSTTHPADAQTFMSEATKDPAVHAQARTHLQASANHWREYARLWSGQNVGNVFTRLGPALVDMTAIQASVDKDIPAPLP